ncbi:hypothetical protein EG19_07255 [Thermoanaerobaculum aquaticum]|uniref:Protein kinase domain-containing protein n=1 Tax=Thermoanaerobaculum aquaticum TaxID=1312852 RepID=A0A062XXD2_9BACT|nr:serine/threonine-protein kinase [Thermoanaerobaculum aquaticum]KDA53165.1 hypothetical protein EG19_07255 [Thermoanaerobaculum aquaticum]
MATVLEQVQEKYELLGKIKEGGMGAIYKVRHKLLGEERVVKIMRPQLEGDQEFAVRFVREAQTLIRVRHPNIAQLYDFFADEAGNAAMVMEYIPGIDLRELLRRHGPPSLGLAVEVAFQSLEAIGFLHRRNMVHRDISPDNLMLCRDADGKPLVKLIDLGIVKVLEAEATGLTSTGMFIGKVRYASPEQFKSAEGAKLDQRSDLYSFGVVLYELLTGRLPVVGDTASALIAAHLYHPPLGFDVTDPQGRVPSDLRDLVLKLLAKEPSDRPANAEAVQELLRQLKSRYRFSPEELEKVLPPQEELQATALTAPPTAPSGQPRTQTTAPTAGWEPTAPTVPAPAPTAPAVTPAPTPAVTPAPPTQKPKRWLWVAAGVTLVAVLAGGLLFARRFLPKSQSAAANPSTGVLVVHAVPWARVLALKDEQGKSLPLPSDAVTPLYLPLPPGNYSLELSDPETGKTVATTVQVRPGLTTRSVIPLREIPAEEFLKELGWR